MRYKDLIEYCIISALYDATKAINKLTAKIKKCTWKN